MNAKGDRIAPTTTTTESRSTTPLPRWFLWILWASIIWSALYWLNVPGVGIGKGRSPIMRPRWPRHGEVPTSAPPPARRSRSSQRPTPRC
jgi:hypothetical protein